jgi:hypothetical protein
MLFSEMEAKNESINSSRQIDLKSEDIKIILEKITPWVFRSFWFWKDELRENFEGVSC